LLAFYLLPFVAVAFAVLAAFWRVQSREKKDLLDEIEQVRGESRQLERERDSAMRELFHRFCEEGELNKERSKFQAQLAEYEKYAALTQLALGAAHEINNPLLGILSHLELELRTATEEDRQEIEQCIEGARRISVTLRSLMNYARPDPLILSKVNLHRLVGETVDFLYHQPMFHGRVLESRVPPSLPAILVDANQLSQVLMNLLLNAAQATAQGGRIEVSANRALSGNAVEIHVTDTGCGIPPDILPHVFEPFFTTKRGKGTGLGLSISQAYVRSHNGEIHIDSALQRGTEVTITLPLRPADPPPLAADEPADSQEVIIE
jgi:signal transduction histidine kinase